MKQFLLALFCLVTLGLTAADNASAKTSEQPRTYKSWSPFQLGLFPGIPSYVNDSRVIGVKTGWPISSGLGSTVDGFESSWIYSGTDRVNGLQASIFMDISKYVIGFAPAGALNINTREFIGFQAAPVMNLAGEITGLQAGAFNVAATLNGYQPGVIGCISREANGLQTALFTVAKKLNGVQFSVVNVCGDVGDTFFQMGLVNVATKKHGIQLGLVNVIKDGWVPFLPFFNICY